MARRITAFSGYKTEVARGALGLALLCAGCSLAPDKQPLLTGHHGGLLPGMILPESATAAKPDRPPGYTGIQNEVQPDGRILQREFFEGQFVRQTWFSSVGLPEETVIYEAGAVPKELLEYGPDGKLQRHTLLYSGTQQPERIEVYAAGGTRITYFLTYWPNGNRHIVSESDVPGKDGPLNRVQEWYDNGLQKMLKQTLVVRDYGGVIVGELLHDRQTGWDENGRILYDQMFNNGKLMGDYTPGAVSASH